MLTATDIERYHHDGYLIPSFRVSNDVVDSICAHYDQLLARYPEFRDNCGALLRYDMVFADYAHEPRILDMVAQIIGPDIALWNMSFFAKPAVNGKAVPWHQDGEYWPIRPLATCTLWIALDDSTPENGCLQVIRGSHRDRALRKHQSNPSPDLVLHEELAATEFDEGEAVDIVLRRGQVSLHDVYLVHGSAPNTSEKPRRGITMRFMPTTSLYDRKLAATMFAERQRNNLSIVPVLLMRGTDQHGGNTFEDRTTATPIQLARSNRSTSVRLSR